MRNIIVLVALVLSTIVGSAQNELLIYEKDWVGETEFTYWYNPNDVPFVELGDEGLAINNSQMQDYIWSQQVVITEDNITLEAAHDYFVRLTLKVPSDGSYYIQLGDWASSWYDEFPVMVSDDWQMIDVEYPNFYCDMDDGHVLIGNGCVVGTTILKNVRVYERINDENTAINSVKAVNSFGAIYNLAGQKVDFSYKGIVIVNGKKLIQK